MRKARNVFPLYGNYWFRRRNLQRVSADSWGKTHVNRNHGERLLAPKTGSRTCPVGKGAFENIYTECFSVIRKQTVSEVKFNESKWGEVWANHATERRFLKKTKGG